MREGDAETARHASAPGGASISASGSAQGPPTGALVERLDQLGGLVLAEALQEAERRNRALCKIADALAGGDGNRRELRRAYPMLGEFFGGFTAEGLNNTIKLLKKNAYDYKSFARMRRRLLFTLGYYRLVKLQANMRQVDAGGGKGRNGRECGNEPAASLACK